MSLVRAFLLLQHQYSSVYFELSGFIYYRCFVSNPFHKTFSVLPPTLCLLCINCSTGRQSRTESEGRRGREGVDDQYLLSGSRGYHLPWLPRDLHISTLLGGGELRHQGISLVEHNPSTYDHRVWKTGLPVRSAVLKPHAGRLVVGWRLREITDPSSSQLATKEENPYHHLRITVTSGGCHGFQYLMSLEAASKIDPEEDTVFEAEPEQGTTSGAGEAKVVMDEPSLELLSGSTVDYTMELIGSQFKIVDNPRATSNCGCGTSFDVKD
ncbi:putative iron-sulfur cluster assembly accessory protein Isa2 [Aspergillus fumigatus]|uniref:Iron-sulfur cluster assembly accessory protein Isa2, putative n=4 Tax=Aspergillus fumigatus TaxID=746128 RepID=Q4X1D3_ASPFU|nr:iron-sulfur cluster assembly accessory protein Isa2, putative [Aspergillus fumigatus Af293]EAL93332.1 iron-sulfur cluster assembly accessory protein Isa2, putative [Aspergillus fumigatus Af293]EDP54559.1 iron-sulfur cluster assembly accessory protein Isa2, putative [Aspergillus fumigatus A1163]